MYRFATRQLFIAACSFFIALHLPFKAAGSSLNARWLSAKQRRGEADIVGLLAVSEKWLRLRLAKQSQHVSVVIILTIWARERLRRMIRLI